ncbi:MAG: PAS-domain containing protein, partial [Hyphomicrobiaceae bacterium]
MIDGWVIITASLAYVSVLFVVAWAGDRYIRLRKGGNGRPITYSLSLAVYCTSWTFFGSVGLAASTGFDFLPVYVGPILMFLLGWPLLVRILRIAKAQNITSIADFMAARYGKSQAVGAIVTIIAVLGTLPYIALQLKAVVISVDVLAGTTSLDEVALGSIPLADTALIVALTLAAFAVLFGTRHVDATEHQEGLMLAIALESIVKLTAFLAVGVFVTFWLLGGFEEIVQRVESSVETLTVFTRSFNGGTWLTITLLSFVCIILLPRQFHVAVVENNSEAEIRRARWLFPLYLVLINIFVVPIAVAGLQLLPPGSVTADMFVLAVPLSHGASLITTIAFIGGISAATAMVIVDSVALAIMVSNNVVMPLLLSRRLSSLEQIEAHEDMAVRLIRVRRVTIFAILLLGYVVYHVLGSTHGLAQIGLLSFAAIAQFAPAFFGGLIWRKATAKGAMAGMLAGFSVWAYTLLLPWIVKAGLLPMSIVADGPLGIGFLKPQTLFFLQFDPLTHGVIWSLAANVIAYITVSLLRSPEPIERLQANIFVHDDLPRVTPSPPSFRLWRTTITVGDLQQTAARYLGPERAQRSFEEFASERGPLVASTEADVATLKFTEHLLASAIGTASSRLVLSLLLRRHHVGSQSALKLLDDASEALQYNRDLLQSALDQVGQGLAVFDRDMRLVCWNRQFRELLDLPAELGRVGMPLDRIVR